jgi:hypothetical protein
MFSKLMPSSEVAQQRFVFDWRELDGPPVAKPQRKGFGLVILKTVVPAVFGGTAELETRASGASWHLEAPLNNLVAVAPTTTPAHGAMDRKKRTVGEICNWTAQRSGAR